MVKITTDELCEGRMWGPWHDGMLTECFLQLTIMSALGLFMLLGGLVRLFQLRKLEKDKNFGKIQIMKIMFCIILTMLEAGSLAARFFVDDYTWYQVMADIRDTVCWGLCTIVISLEFASGSGHSWVVRLWWVLEFIGICLIMQALATRDKGSEGYAAFGYDVFMVIVRFGIVTLLTIFGLWVNENSQKKTVYSKLKETDDSSSSSKSYGSFSKLKVENSKNPFKTANVFSKLLFLWPSSLVSLGSKRTLNFSDLWDLPEEDTADYCTTKLEQNWVDELNKDKPSLAKAIWTTYGRVFLVSGLGKLLQDAGTLFGPIVLNELITYVEDPNAPLSRGLYWSLAMFGSFIIQSLGANFNLFISTRIGNQIRAAIISLVYRKSVRISSSARSKFSTGEVINYQAIDATRLAFVTPLLHMIWSAPLQIIISLYLLWGFLGPSMFAGVGVLVLLTPLNGFAAKKMLSFQKVLMTKRDKRVRLMSELLNGIRLVKFFNWEDNFYENINVAREEELDEQIKSSKARAAVMFIFMSTPLWVASASFTAFVLSGKDLTAEIAFTSLALFNTLRMPLGFLPMVISAVVESKLAISRVQKFLVADDMDPDSVVRHIDHSSVDSSSPRTVIKITNGTFAWGRETQTNALKDINLNVLEGELIAVIGTVGSGKSSLLHALLGEIHQVTGKVAVVGSTAYAPQQAWMQNSTLKENILFGKSYMEAKYQHCINCCELMQDIKILPNGDLTEIGEKGINLSGGQKQRISLARAMYQDAAVYLLDSPLSAVDAHVGNAIFNNLILGALGHTTRIFVTHQLDILHKVDRIVVMNNGQIAEIGTYTELMRSGLDFSELLSKHVGVRSPEEKGQAKEAGKPEWGRKKEEDNNNNNGGVPKQGGKLIGQEERWEGSVSWAVYGRYLAAAGISLALCCLFFYGLENGGRVSNDWWLSFWSSQDGTANNKKYLGIYVAWGTAAAISTLGRSFAMVYATLRAAKTMHNSMLRRILHAPMSFFDTTPTGRILNRFSKDMASLDENLPMALQGFFNTSFFVLSIAFVISFVTPFFLVALLPISYAYYFMQQYYLSSSREVQRLDSVSKSPIYALFSETLTGITTIRSFGAAQDFINNNDKKVDKNNKALFVFNGIARWLAIRLEMMCTIVVSLSALFCVIEKDNITPGLAGLSLTYALQLTQILNFLVRQSAEVETNIVAVERIVEYADLPIEAPYHHDHKVPRDWPYAGEIQFRNLKMRYRPNLDLVIRGITATIKPQEKVGVVGRTGAGKSSLFLGIFRLIEAAEGSILIDNIDISKIGLSELRSRLAIIPQDPTLFIGTIRTNLDPFKAYRDDEIWSALESVHMKEAIQQLPEKMDSPVVENGENFSVGQRQLLCLGRALLRNAKILLMDEATASVDMETDALIQKTIREKFKNMTVITIAHRINTIVDSDRVMVLDKGEMVEFDSPQKLSEDPSSIFYSLLQE